MRGAIETEFKVPYLSTITFKHAYYGTDGIATLIVQVSDDGVNWVEIDRFATQDALEQTNIHITDTVYTTNNFVETEGLYVKISKTGGNRVNIDDMARIYFYMATMWDHLTLSNTLPTGDTYTLEGAEHGYLSALIAFHFDDPVDSFEI